MSPAVSETQKAVAGSPKSGEPSSIALTIESCNKARQVVVVAEEPRGTFPAQLLEKPLFFLDAEAAAELQDYGLLRTSLALNTRLRRERFFKCTGPY
jgi:hypothetical protein